GSTLTAAGRSSVWSEHRVWVAEVVSSNLTVPTAQGAVLPCRSRSCGRIAARLRRLDERRWPLEHGARERDAAHCAAVPHPRSRACACGRRAPDDEGAREDPSRPGARLDTRTHRATRV